MKRIEYKEVVKKENTVVSIQCDVCKKESNTKEVPNDWHEFDICHHHWGNDSVDSHETYHVCSVECYVKQLKEIGEEYANRKWGEIDSMNIPFALKFIDALKI